MYALDESLRKNFTRVKGNGSLFHLSQDSHPITLSIKTFPKILLFFYVKNKQIKYICARLRFFQIVGGIFSQTGTATKNFNPFIVRKADLLKIL